MMGPEGGRPITIGVVDQPHAALAFAAEEASLCGCDLRLVHVYTVPPSPPQVMNTAYGFDIEASFRSSGSKVLADATDFLLSHYGDVGVSTVLDQGAAAMVLIGTSASSRLIVLGPDTVSPWYARLFQGHVSRRVTEEALCPVVVVPDSWTARSRAKGVTLLLDSQTIAHGPLRFAFEQASRHHEILRVLHIAASDGAHDEAVPWHDMHRLIDSWRSTYPHVLVDTTVVSGDADLKTVETFERTALLVLGRPHQHHELASLQRSLARAVIEHADCPVAVVPPDYDA